MTLENDTTTLACWLYIDGQVLLLETAMQRQAALEQEMAEAACYAEETA